MTPLPARYRFLRRLSASRPASARLLRRVRAARIPPHVTEDVLSQLRAALAGRYGVEREIATGGMATVYLVHDEKHLRQVALKIMKPGVAEGGAQRFLREIGVTARLSHPHILPLLDSGSVEGLPFYVMPYVEGETLRERITRDKRLSVPDAVNLAAEIADALAYAHAQGIVHRDIKPANILLSGRHAVVADFGVARALVAPASGFAETQMGYAVGTVAYMSPEQAVGDTTIDGRSDVYSLGIVLFEMLVGEKAFEGSTAHEQIAKRFSGIIPSARAKRNEIPVELDAVIARALAPDPEHRYATAGEFETALLSSARARAMIFDTGAIHIAREPDVVPSVAVLPFQNLSGSDDNDYLSDGITEEILTQLSLRRTLRVCARVSSFALRETTDDVRAIAARLGVRHVLMGSMRRAADRLRVSAQLVDATTGFQVWSGRFDRLLADVFAIQDEIGSAIAGALNATLLGEITAPAQVKAPRLEVYEALLKGRHLWNRRTADSTQRAIASYRQALALDPEYAPAHAGLAEAYLTQAIYGTVAPRDAMPLARASAEAALALDASLAEARAALAQVEAAHEWRWGMAEAMFRQAIALNPQLSAAHQGLAIMTLTPRGRHTEAQASVERALTIDPLSPVQRVTLGSVHLYAGRFAAARDTVRAVIALEPAFSPAHYFLSQSLTELGDHTAAITSAERAVELSGRSSEALAVLGAALARAGQGDRARAVLADLDLAARATYASPAHRAVVHLALGDASTALDLLDEAADVRASDLVWLAVRPAWGALRQHPRFAALLSRLHLAETF